MALLTGARNTPSLGLYRPLIPQPMEANTSAYVGGMGAWDANGLIVPAQPLGSSPLSALIIAGVIGGSYFPGIGPGFPGQNPINQVGTILPGGFPAGAAGVIAAELWTGTFLFDIDSASITQVNVGALCYAVDDHTVNASSNSNVNPVAGRIVGLPQENPGMVWVDLTRQS